MDIYEFIEELDSKVVDEPLNEHRYRGGRVDTLHTKLAKFREVHGDKYDYTAVRLGNSRQEVAIRCKIHGLFYMTPRSHVCGAGCPSCERPSDILYIWRDEVSGLFKVGITLKTRRYERIRRVANSFCMEYDVWAYHECSAAILERKIHIALRRFHHPLENVSSAGGGTEFYKVPPDHMLKIMEVFEIPLI